MAKYRGQKIAESFHQGALIDSIPSCPRITELGVHRCETVKRLLFLWCTDWMDAIIMLNQIKIAALSKWRQSDYHA